MNAQRPFGIAICFEHSKDFVFSVQMISTPRRVAARLLRLAPFALRRELSRPTFKN